MSDALLLVSFGGPEGPEDVMPFLRNVTRGRNVPDERLAAVAEHYHHFGGRSPVNDQIRDLLARLGPALVDAGVELPVYWGNRNWHPLLADTLRQVADDGHRHVVALATSAWSSYSGCRQYREDLARAAADADVELSIVKIRPFHDHPGFVEAQVDRARSALTETEWSGPPQLVFVAHSIPVAMAATSDYADQVEVAADRVVERLDTPLAHDLAWCSRSGPPSVPWLEPDVNDHLRALATEGVTNVLLVPVGFVSDHMEVAWDLDVEAAATAQQLGMQLVRAASVGTHPAFVDALVDLFSAAVAGQERRTLADTPTLSCDEMCCRLPDAADLPVVAAV
ncbi:MAG TPA: ferrochelatase [Nitriliruptorales bacterium]